MVTRQMAAGQKDATETRARILLSAQQAFARNGYHATGLREIAAAALCDPALIRRYFGSKERLFEQALTEALGVHTLTLVEDPESDT